ncbi:MAG: cytochrome P450, partial [bacterium]
MGGGIFNTNGERWHQQREFAKGLFLPESLKHTMAIFEKYAHQLAGHLDAKGLHTNVDMQDFFMRYTLTSFGEAGFGAELGAI